MGFFARMILVHYHEACSRLGEILNCQRTSKCIFRRPLYLISPLFTHYVPVYTCARSIYCGRIFFNFHCLFGVGVLGCFFFFFSLLVFDDVADFVLLLWWWLLSSSFICCSCFLFVCCCCCCCCCCFFPVCLLLLQVL